MKSLLLLLSALACSPAALLVTATPIGPRGPCAQNKVDAILQGTMDPSECCPYGTCKGDVVVSVGN